MHGQQQNMKIFWATFTICLLYVSGILPCHNAHRMLLRLKTEEGSSWNFAWCRVFRQRETSCNWQTYVEQLLRTLEKLRRATISFAMTVRSSAWNNLAPTGWIFMKFVIWVLSENLSINQRFNQNGIRITGTLRDDQYTSTLITIPRSVLLRIRNISDKSCRENQNTHFKSNNFPPLPPDILTVYELMHKNIVQPEQATDNMAHAHGMLDT